MTLATCAKDVKFYRWPTICYIGVYETPIDCMTVKTISWSSDGKDILAVKSKGCPVILNAPSRLEQCIEPYDFLYLSHASVGTFSNKSPELLAFGSEEGIVNIYNVKSPRHPIDLVKLPSPIQNLEFSQDDQCLAAGCVNGQIFLLDSNYKPCASLLIPNSPTLSTIAYSKITSNLLAGASKEGVLSLWDTETTNNIFCNKKHCGRITDLAFFDNAISSVGSDGKYVRYDLRMCKCICNYELDCSLSSLAHLRGTNELAISTTSGQLRSYDLRHMKSPLRTLVASVNGGIKKIAFPNVTDEMYPPSSTYCMKFGARNYEEEFSASGDFSIQSDISPGRSRTSDLKNLILTEDPVEDGVEVISEIKPTKNSELEDFGRMLEDRIKVMSKDFEDKLLQTFYGLRISTSKQFIGLEEKISQSWNNFVDYLRLSGAGTVCHTGDKSSGENIAVRQVSSPTIGKFGG